mmetsp:Transcript_113336/g.195818  ORF Transcript_113336/g.195818 Transcript_113336/m.195818 type:complete len:90 (-) Transcript_113336:53-322(-)
MIASLIVQSYFLQMALSASIGTAGILVYTRCPLKTTKGVRSASGAFIMSSESWLEASTMPAPLQNILIEEQHPGLADVDVEDALDSLGF